MCVGRPEAFPPRLATHPAPGNPLSFRTGPPTRAAFARVGVVNPAALFADGGEEAVFFLQPSAVTKATFCP